ncbi:AfsR/SARP family transcriptional regulator [Actinomadura sp. NAK00032]|uniref:BTAD domain-containing putative transcriptional regulator n=1 Tax=Actinomadura sp. NAK00032 TaxID=2742128 RepID=UPI00159237BC|nr:BTAD domain-containing putative transcriptional regulator [Actinomadura sp. NAK00032]QKW36898.1 AfsR/SARP family transcriptional regulator [Actinomadura sp. NAK00032]
MRFGVLGPLAVWTDDGAAVRVPELKVRALLADLLVHRGRAVSVDQLVDDLWGGAARPPRNPVGTLQTRVSQLRRALDGAEPGGRGLLVSQAPGYLLRVDPEAVDGDRFHALAGQARATEDPQARAVLLADALGLWRGRAYADFADEEFVRPDATRLEDERFAVQEEHAEVRLELGEHAVLAGELSEQVARHPLRERLRAVHLRALYRAGRQSEALAGFEDLRHRLAEDLGVDPSPELAALHQAILEQDPRLDAPRPAVRAATAPPRAVPANLPAPLTDLVGRDAAVSEVRALLDDSRLVTLTGPGGVGKTRLALATARALTGADADERFPDGVWLVELSGLDRASGATPADAIAMVLGVRDDDAPAAETARRTPVELLAGALAAKRLLLVLDNCEHVIDPVAVQVAALLRAAPGVRVLATSQESLALSGERLWPVPPLGEADAVRLFTARAAAAAPDFAPGPGDTATIAAVCRRLDGIPLAVELAATRVRALGVDGLADRLDDRFRLLTSGSRDAPARQRTLRAMIDWSWELLAGDERAVLRRLAVHADGCTLGAAEEVCAQDGLDVLDVLARLVDRSLVVRVEGTGGGRYRLLESVKAYCAERLDEAGESAEIRARFVRHHVALAVRAEPHLYGHDQRRWLELLDAEAANQRAALEDALRLGLAADALRLVDALAWHWYLRGRLTEALRSLDAALAVEGGPPEARAKAAVWRAGFVLLTNTEAAPEAATSYEGVRDPGARAWARWFLAFAHRGFGDLEVTGDLVRGALAEFRGLGERWGTAAALSVRATVHRARARLDAARRDAEESEALFRGLGDRWGRLKATNTLAELAEIAGDYDRAARLHEEGLRMAEELGLWAEASLRLSGLGRISLLTGDHAAADDRHHRALRLAADQSNKVAEHFAAVGLALSARRRGDLDAAEARLLPWLDWIRAVDGEPGLALVLAELGFAAEQRGDAGAALARHRDGLAARIGDPRAVALAFEGLAGARSLAGDARPAARLLGAAAALRASAGAPLPAAERADVDRIAARVRTLLGADAFAAEYACGESDPDTASPPGPGVTSI